MNRRVFPRPSPTSNEARRKLHDSRGLMGLVWVLMASVINKLENFSDPDVVVETLQGRLQQNCCVCVILASRVYFSLLIAYLLKITN